MGYFGKQVGRPVVQAKEVETPRTLATSKPHFAAQVGKQVVMASSLPPTEQGKIAAAQRCPRCMGMLAEGDGLLHCGGRCGGRWVMAGGARLLDPATLPLGVCGCCLPRVPLVRAEVGAVCPQSHGEYLVLPEGVMARATVAPLGICHCCLPPQPLVEVANYLVCRNKPQQHYAVVEGAVTWIGLAPVVEQAGDQAAVTAAIDAALRANSAELTLFGLFAPP